MEEEQPPENLDDATATLSGEPTTVFVNVGNVNQGPVVPVQKNQAAKVIGILVIIWGVFNLLASPLNLLSAFNATDIEGNPISYPTEYFVITILSAVIAGAVAIFGGYQVTQYKKKGIWITFAAFAIAWISSIITSTIAGSAMDTEATGAAVGAGMGAFTGICGIVCYAICGAIVAIPLMLSDGGME